MAQLNRKLKILTLSNCDLNTAQGSGYVIVNFAEGLRNRGHLVDLYGPEQLFLIAKLGKARHLNLSIGMLRFVVSAVRRATYDIVELYGGEACLAAYFLAQLSRRSFRIVAHSNGVDPHYEEATKTYFGHTGWDGKPTRWYQGKVKLPVKYTFECADAIVTVSNFDRDYTLRRRYQDADSILAIENALTKDYVNRVFTETGRANTVGFCGSWLPNKGKEIITKDVSEFLRKNQNWSFHLVGVGDAFVAADYFPQEVLRRVKVTPFVSSKSDLRNIYSSWRIAIMPSIYESFGLVAAEAMACGCALVTSSVGFGASLVNGKEAVVLSTKKSPELYNALSQLVSNESMRRNIAYNGYCRVQSLTWENSLDQIEAFYQKLVDETRK